MSNFNMERLKGYVQSGDVDMVKIETKYNKLVS